MTDFVGRFVDTPRVAREAYTSAVARIIPLSPSGTELVPPVVENVVPVDGSVLQPTDTISFRTRDDVAITLVAIGIEFLESGAFDVVWLRDKFAHAYRFSTRTVIDPRTIDWTLRRFGGWRRGMRPKLHIEPVDTSGNLST